MMMVSVDNHVLRSQANMNHSLIDISDTGSIRLGLFEDRIRLDRAEFPISTHYGCR